jgi:NitT/TauT family transport system ATP-binding protein
VSALPERDGSSPVSVTSGSNSAHLNGSGSGSAPAASAGRGLRIDANGLVRRFARADGSVLHALGPIDLALRPGEFFSIVGPSGCGKSTLIDILAGLAAPEEGSASADGVPFAGSVPNGVGMVLQEDASFPWLSVWDNVAFGLKRLGRDTQEIHRRVDHALAFMGLKDFAKARPLQLSGGMRQRMCIARTLVLEPRFLVLDEPFGALDQQTRLLMGEELLRVWRETGATVLLITHSLDEAALLSDRVAIMSARPGRIMEVIETGWHRDRDSTVASTPEFGAITARLWDQLRGESMKSMRGNP